MKKKRTIFQKRLKELYNQLDRKNKNIFKNEILRNENRYYNLLKIGVNSPCIEEVREIADYFGVDSGYLLGDYDYPNTSAIHLAEILGISEKACDVIQTKIGTSELKETFEKMIVDKNFISLLKQVYRYSYSYTREICIKDTAGISKTEIIDNPEDIASFMSEGAKNIFSDIIRSIYDSNIKVLKDIKISNQVENFIRKLVEYKHIIDDIGDDSVLPKIYKIIEDDLSEIRKTDDSLVITKISPKKLLDNAELLLEDMDSEYPYGILDDSKLKKLKE